MKKPLAFGIGILLLVTPLVTSAQSTADLQAVLQSLLAQLVTLQQQVNQVQTGVSVSQPSSSSQNLTLAPLRCPSFSRPLWRGLRGSDVTELQNYLISQGLLADDSASGFYGTATEAAVQRWQSSIGLITSGAPNTTGWGVFGEQSRSALTRRCGGTTPVYPIACPLVPIVDCAPGYGPTSGGYDANGCEQRTRCIPVSDQSSFSASPTSGSGPLQVNFKVSTSVDIANATLDFGDGTRCGAGVSCGWHAMNPGVYTASHMYSSAGTYTATLMRSDGQFLPAFTHIGTATITVSGTSSRESCSFKSHDGNISTSGTQGLGSQGACVSWCTSVRNEKYSTQYSGICRYTSSTGAYTEIQLGATTAPASVTVTSVVPTEKGSVVNVTFKGIPAGRHFRIIGVNGAAQSLPVSASSRLDVPGGYSGNQVAEYTHYGNQDFAALLVPSSAPAGSYVVEVSNPSSGWLTELRTPAFAVGRASSAASIAVVSAVRPGIVFDFKNLPAGVQGVFLTRAQTGTNVTSAQISSGSGRGTIYMPDVSPSGTYYLRVLATINNELVARSENFEIGGKTRIELTSPLNNASLSSQQAFPFDYIVWNAPARSQVEIEVQRVPTENPNGSALEIWRWQSSELPSGNSSGRHNSDSWDAGTPGFPVSTRALPSGTYRVYAFVLDCHPSGCHYPRLGAGRNNDSIQHASVEDLPRTFTIAGQPSSGITVTSPNGGEVWEAGTMNTITWTPYGYNPDINPPSQVSAYLVPEGKGSSGKIVPSGKASIHWEGEILDDVMGPQRRPNPGTYRIRVVNNVTGQSDTSDRPFTIVPHPVDLKINGSDGPVSVNLGQTVTLSWTSTSVDYCEIHNAYPDASRQQQIGRVPSSGSAQAYLHSAGWGPTLYCYRNGRSNVADSVQVNAIATPATLQIRNPNGGEQITIGQPYQIKFSSSGIGSASIALYRNDQWMKWIVQSLIPISRDFPQDPDPSIYEWTPTMTDLGAVHELGGVFKIYITGQRSDGNGYVDDKSDAPFSFTGSTPPPPPPPVGPAAPTSWKVFPFAKSGSSSCAGVMYNGYSQKYGVWIGAQLCGGSDTYKLYMSSSEQGTYYQIADTAGHGQDHCELVNPNFTIPNEDDITSGTCKNCSVGGLVDVQNELVFSRANFGESFVQAQSTFWSDLTTNSYKCGVSIGAASAQSTSSTNPNLASAYSALESALKALVAKIAQ